MGVEEEEVGVGKVVAGEEGTEGEEAAEEMKAGPRRVEAGVAGETTWRRGRASSKEIPGESWGGATCG